MLHLDRLASSYKNEGFSVLSISIDTQRSFSEVKRYVRTKRYNFDVFIESIKNSIVQAEKQANYIIKDAYIRF